MTDLDRYLRYLSVLTEEAKRQADRFFNDEVDIPKCAVDEDLHNLAFELAQWTRMFLDAEPDEVCIRHFLSPHVSDGYCDYILARQDKPLHELEACDIQLIRWVVVS